MYHHITQIIDTIPFQIQCEFDGKEIRNIDFNEILNENKNPFIQKLRDEKVFNQVKLDKVSKTIYWENLAQIKDYDGQIKPCELDFDPTVLYNISKAQVK
ncbi:MAG: DUF2442 domain-containing protein [Chitinophagaceae bacterium]